MTSSSHSDSFQEQFPPDLSSLLSEAGVEGSYSLQKLDGGANNRVFRIEIDGRRLLLKWYFSHPDDPRDRLKAEFSFSCFAWQNGIRSLPQPLTSSASSGLALYEYIDGRHVSSAEITGRHIEAALNFYGNLNRHKLRPDAQQLQNASEACFSLRDHLSCVEHRLQVLRHIDHEPAVHSDALRFVEHKLVSVFNDVVEFVHSGARRWNIPLDSLLGHDNRCLSPSDFGFHNAIEDEAGTMRFIDFEYAGWDDPAKMVCDFFLQIEVAVPLDYLTEFTESVTALESQPENLQHRIRLLFPVYKLKWCCILLNEFLPTPSARRRFSRMEEDVNRRKESQLAKARQMISRIMESPIENSFT